MGRDSHVLKPARTFIPPACSWLLDDTRLNEGPWWVNSLRPSDVYMRQWTGSTFVQVMAWHRTGDKPLPGPMLVYCQLDSWEQILVKIDSEFYHFHSRKCIWNCHLPKWRSFFPGGDELTHWDRVTYICINKLIFIGSDKGLSSDRRQIIFWTNGGILLIDPLRTNFGEILIEIHTLSFKKMHLNISSLLP